ncbi:MAG TPA: nuclear transport factor 2 family protein [Pyrinomonadaceae bacterium]|jgi:ketosteroid isomerase-like protein
MNEVEKETLRMEEELTQTETRLDVEALDLIYADDIMVTAPIGICVDKPAVMSEIRQAAEKAIIGRYDKDDLKVRAYGETAVSSYRMTAWATVEGTEIKRALCITNVWMKRNSHWQIVARHTQVCRMTHHRRAKLASNYDGNPIRRIRPAKRGSERKLSTFGSILIQTSHHERS